MNPQMLYALLGLVTFGAIILGLGAVIAPTNFSTEMNNVPPQTTSYTPLGPQSHFGRTRRSTFFYALAGNEAQNTTIIALAIIPKGARVSKSDIFIDAGPGVNTTFDIGVAARDGSGIVDPNTSLAAEAATYAPDLFYGINANASVADTGNFFGSFAPANAAAAGNFADTLAHKVGYIAKKDLLLIATVKTANVTAAANIYGYVNYVID